MLMSIRSFWVALSIFALLAGGFGCGGDGEEGSSSSPSRDLSNLCTTSVEQFKAVDPGKDFETFKLTMQNVIKSCGGACDAEDQGSCGELEKMVTVLCKTSPQICKVLCEAEKSPSVKKIACKQAAAPAPAKPAAKPAAGGSKMPELCKRAEGHLQKALAEKGDLNEAMKLLTQSCSLACDDKDQASCGVLTRFMGVFCKTSASSCASLCKTVKSPSLKALACKPAASP